MRYGFPGSLAAVVAVAGLAVAQLPPPAAPAGGVAAGTAAPGTPDGRGGVPTGPAPDAAAPFGTPAAPGGYPPAGPEAGTHAPAPPADLAAWAGPRPPYPPHCWVTADYLLWWVERGPLPVPLVSTGRIDEAGSEVLFGDSRLDYGSLSGGRLAAGLWCDDFATVGIEAKGFLLQTGSVHATFAAAGAGATLGLPFVNTVTGREDIFPVTQPGQTVGTVDVSSSSQLGGAEGNALFNLYRDGHHELSLSAGFRYLDLREDLTIDTTTAPLLISQVAFGGNFFGPPAITTTADRFATANHFYGGQIGGRWECRFGGLFASVAGNLALGDTREVVEVSGSSSLNAGPVPQRTLPGGIFALPSNIGRFAQDDFAVVPEAELKVGYQLTRHLSVFAGYDALYWSRVVRPGDQIDRGLSPAQVPTANAFGRPADVSQPAPLFNPTDLWAQGINVGLEIRY